MIELRHDALEFSFPDVHADARFTIDFQRTLRIPDDGGDYPLPAGLGRFPLRHVDDFAGTVPPRWLQHGGVMMPMYQSEALWLNFHGFYPFAVKVAAGKINAVSGGEWDTQLHFGPSPSQRRTRRSGEAEQDYVVLPDQPWLDGFNVGQGRIRQFVAMPLGEGYTAEEQITGKAETGGLQLLAYPMKASYYREVGKAVGGRLFAAMAADGATMAFPADMGLGLGGLMRQDISADFHDPDVWDLAQPARCFVHLANSAQWAAITGEAPPTEPLTAKDYQNAGIPWFSYYAAGDVVPGSPVLQQTRSVSQIAAEKGDIPPDDSPIPIDRVTHLQRPRSGTVRELSD